MRGRLPAVLAVAAGVAVVLASAISAPAKGRVGAAARAAATELIYVANADSGPVTAYTAGSHGAVASVRTVANPNNPNTFWDPWGVAFDTTGHLYVQTFLSEATTFVFPPGAHGRTLPSRIFRAQGPDNQAIAVDAKGFEYVVGGETFEAVNVVRPGANGRPGDLYGVAVARTIPIDESFNPWASVAAVDAKNEVLVAVARPRGNAIEVFAGGAHGGQRPVRVITGSRTGLGSCPGTPSPCDEVSIAFSALTGRIYAAVSDGPHRAHISVFAGNATGNAPPVRTIEGRATGLSGKVIVGMAVSPRDGTIYAMVKTSSDFGPGRIYAYRRYAHGNAAPLRSFTDRTSAFANSLGLAILELPRHR